MIELMLIMVLVGVVAIIAIPRFGSDTINRPAASANAREIASDMRLARSLAVSDAAANPDGYAVSMTGGPSYTGYEIVNLGTAAVLEAKTLHTGITCTGDAEFQFGPLGNLFPASGTTLTVTGGGKQYALTVVFATGSVIIQEQ